jgi:hypothetical protein
MGTDPEASTALDRTPLLFAHPAPYTGVLARVESPLKALIDH